MEVGRTKEWRVGETTDRDVKEKPQVATPGPLITAFRTSSPNRPLGYRICAVQLHNLHKPLMELRPLPGQLRQGRLITTEATPVRLPGWGPLQPRVRHTVCLRQGRLARRRHQDGRRLLAEVWSRNAGALSACSASLFFAIFLSEM